MTQLKKDLSEYRQFLQDHVGITKTLLVVLPEIQCVQDYE